MKGSHLKVSNSKSYKNNMGIGISNGGRGNMFSQEDYSDNNSPNSNSARVNGSGITPPPFNKLAINMIGSHLATPGPMSGSRMFPNTRAGCQVPNSLAYNDTVNEIDFPETGLNSMDYNKRLRFEQLKNTRIESLCKWKQKDVKGIKKNAYIKEIQKKNDQILTVADKTELEKLEVYTDRFPILHFRK